MAARLLADAMPLTFAHPLVRAAVYGDVPRPRRGAMHARAARLLSEDGAAVDAIAGHLLLAEPAGEAWAVAQLRAAAEVALGRGAPESAVRYLRRALAEPPPAADRDAVTAELGLALLRASDPEGIETLSRLRSRSREFAANPQLTVELATSLGARGRTVEATAILADALAAADEPRGRAGWYLRGAMLFMPLNGHEGIPPGAMPGPEETIDTTCLEGRVVLEGTAFLFACGAGSVCEAATLARRVVGDPAVALADAGAGFPPLRSGFILTLADDATTAAALYEPAIETIRRRGALSGVATGLGARALAGLVDGDLRAAEVDAETAFKMMGGHSFVPEAYWLAVLVHVLVERGELGAAHAMLASAMPGAESGPGVPGAALLCARGRLHLAGGSLTEARRDFTAAAERVEWLPRINQEVVGWRVGLAQAQAALGDRAEAERLAAEALTAATATQSRRGIGLALRVQGQIAGADGIETLREAAATLAGTNARLQHAHALVDLGAALRRANHRRDARDPLREGLDLAHRCGATALEQRARTELAATGARPRGATLTGVESLTPSELRVARLAADGLTNREIAQQLYVTAKTVETHLRHVFQKLDVDRRTQITSKL